MFPRRALTHGDIDDIDKSMRESLEYMEARKDDPAYTETEKQAVYGLIDIYKKGLASPPEMKIALYKTIALALNKDYIRRFGEDESTQLVDQYLSTH